MQDDFWKIGQTLGKGINGQVLDATNPFMPGVVLKKGRFFVNHSNVVHVFCQIPTSSSNQGYIALERLGPSIASLLATNYRCAT